MPAESILNIARWQVEYRVPGDHPAVEKLRRKLDDTAERLARDGLSEALRPVLDDEDPSVWLIRRLEMGLTVNADWERGLTAGVWAGRLARALARTLQAGPDGENVLYFPDWAAYLAHFLGDLLAGLAWGRWYYRAFDGLRAMPFSAAARTAVLDDPRAGWDALLRLTATQLSRFVEGLSRQDARRVLDGLSAGSSGPVDLAGLQSACQGILQQGGLWGVASSEDHLALSLALETGRALGRLAGPELAAAARAAAAQRQAETTPAHDVPPPRRYTPFGGLFLLLPELERLPLEEMLAGFPPLSNEDPRAALRLLLLVRAAGPERAPLLFYDPLLRDMSGVGPRFSPEDAAAWLKRAGPFAWQGFLRALSRADADDAAQHLGLVKAPAAGGGVVVLVDLSSGDWRALARFDGRRGSHWRALRPFLENNEPALWQGDPRLLAEAAAWTALPDRGEVNPAQSQDMPPVARLAQVPADLRYLRAPTAWRFPLPADLALALAAQRLMRRFSRGLTGFQSSGMAYLYDQFLNFNAGLEEKGDICTVYLSPAPLGLVLQRAGRLRSSYRLSWLGGRRFDLFPEV